MEESRVERIQLAEFTAYGSDRKKRFDWNAATNFLRSDAYSRIQKLRKQQLLFSLDGFDYINPDGLIWVLLLGDQLKSWENSLWLQLPRDPSQLRYLKSSNFHSVALDKFSIANIFYLDEVQAFRLPESMKFTRVNLGTLGRLMSELDVLFRNVDFLKLMDITPTGRTGMEFLPPLLRTIQETTKNVVQHSSVITDSGSGYFVISKVGLNRVRLCICDAGCGFSSSLQSKGIDINSDFEAIRRALLFRYFKPGGEGLFRVVEFVSRLGGVIRIRSGNGESFLKLQQQPDMNEQDTKNLIDTRLKPVRSRFFFSGVQLQIDFEQA